MLRKIIISIQLLLWLTAFSSPTHQVLHLNEYFMAE